MLEYVAYAKHIGPTLADEASEYLDEKYLKMREFSNGKVVVGARQLEGMVRLSEASAPPVELQY